LEILQFRLNNILKKFVLCLLSFILIGCDENNINIDFLKNNGYKEATCQTVESYQTEKNSFIEINKRFDKEKDFILARCFDKDSCLLNLKFKRKKIVCQRYIISRENQDKRDYLHSDYKEFVDHRVLYLYVEYND
tara:strand:- start:274 stop:678 length:405 start_codon:yes stop_codon:yes gene_type:complete